MTGQIRKNKGESTNEIYRTIKGKVRADLKAKSFTPFRSWNGKWKWSKIIIDNAKLFSIGALKATDVKTMERFAALLHGTLHEEMALHRKYAAQFGISEEELETAEPSPVTLAYTHYMLYKGQNGTLAELVAALLPCAWSYWEIGKELSAIPGASDHELYGEWIRMYSSDEFGLLATWCIELMDQHAEGKTEAELQQLENIFLNTTCFEYMFWDMAYHQQMWPADEAVTIE